MLHTGKFKEVVYQQSNTPASIAKKIYLGGSAADAKKVTSQQMLEAIQNDFDFIYDAIKYHNFISNVLFKAKITVSTLPNSNATPKDIVNVYSTY